MTEYRIRVNPIAKKDLLVFYKIEDPYVSIYRILYSKRDYQKILFNNE